MEVHDYLPYGLIFGNGQPSQVVYGEDKLHFNNKFLGVFGPNSRGNGEGRGGEEWGGVLSWQWIVIL